MKQERSLSPARVPRVLVQRLLLCRHVFNLHALSWCEARSELQCAAVTSDGARNEVVPFTGWLKPPRAMVMTFPFQRGNRIETKSLPQFPYLGLVADYAARVTSLTDGVICAQEVGLRVIEPCGLARCDYFVSFAGEWNVSETAELSVLVSARGIGDTNVNDNLVASILEINSTGFEFTLESVSGLGTSYPIKLSYIAWNGTDITVPDDLVCGENCAVNGVCTGNRTASTCVCIPGAIFIFMVGSDLFNVLRYWGLTTGEHLLWTSFLSLIYSLQE